MSTTINQAVSEIVSGKDLTFDEARDVMDSIMDGECSPVMISSYLTALATKGETVDEIAGSAYEMRAHATRLPGDYSDALEIVGTGGDGSGTFNISTTSAFVVAAEGVRVAKHGNRAASSMCGAADVLEALGARLDNPPEVSARIIDECGFVFMFAQRYHASMRHVAPVRRELGTRTVFNILGPLTNPAFAGSQFSGVYSEELVRPFAGVLDRIGVRNGLVVYGRDRMDEISVCADTRVCELRSGTFDEYVVRPQDFGLPMSPRGELAGGDPAVNAGITRGILGSAIRGGKRDAVLLNAAAGLYTVGKAGSIEEGLEMAGDAVDSGRALSCLKRYVALTGGRYVDRP